MNDRLVVLACVALCHLLGASLAPQLDTRASASQVAKPSPYFGQALPTLSPERFAPGVVSTDAIELNGVFAPDLKEFFFARLIEGVQTMYHAVLVDGAWSAPSPLLLFPGQSRSVADDMAVSPDGRELYFLGNHPHSHSAGVRSSDIWRSRRINGNWSTAEVVPAPISTEASEVYPVVVGDGSLYFSSNRPGGLGRSSVYRAQRLAEGSFAEPVLVAPPVNSEFGVGDVYLSPDESYMVFSSSRPPSPGGGDLFVSFRRPNDGWSEPAATPSTRIRRSSVRWSRLMASFCFSAVGEVHPGARRLPETCTGSMRRS
jgi:hypothetical protein